MTTELLIEAKKNLMQKKGNEEYNSLLPEMLNMIDEMYPGIPLYNFPSEEECPDLGEYNVHYDRAGFEVFRRDHSERQNNVINGSIVK